MYKCTCCNSTSHYWTLLRERLGDERFFRKWNLFYTKTVLATDPSSQMAKALLSCWSPRIQGALKKRFPEQLAAANTASN